MRSLPVIVISGFLGSGKTSLIKQLLSANEKTNTSRLGVIVNEFGEVGLDGESIQSERQTDGTGKTKQIELPGGCVCCLLSDELDKTLADFSQLTPPLDLILVETTGLADPIQIAWSIGKPESTAGCHMRCVVTLLDPMSFTTACQKSPIAVNQVINADIVIVTKLDLKEATAQWNRQQATWRQLNQRAHWICQPPSSILAELQPMIESISPQRKSTNVKPPLEAHGFESLSVAIHHPLDLDDLRDELEALPSNYFRIKGLAWAIDGTKGEETATSIEFHKVGNRVSWTPVKTLSHPRIVVFGTNLQEEIVVSCLRNSMIE